ncbi:asparagine synthase (glutamine-hydrolyzing) [Thalassospira lucentensis]|uniref:asparagine synthase (glutamine-hydrolyzing) n=1 Tax=Thalassospira lucentensis TaxID=168935 RepID=UPI003D2BA50D
MCGITGFVHNTKRHARNQAGLRYSLEKMGCAIRHRGPDSEGAWLDESNGIGMHHLRLAIVDLSSAGYQPMISACERYVICYNGEVYNSGEIVSVLHREQKEFKGHSDTEAILESCAAIGIEATTEKLIGMFAFALWDREERELWLVRDRLGIKPLYWTMSSTGTLIFGSELKALRAHPECPNEIDRDAVSGFMRHNYIAAPKTIYKGIYKLQPGHTLRYSSEMSEPDIRPFWGLKGTFIRGMSAPFEGTDSDAATALEKLLKDAVGRRMIADVPLGAFLSGGIDSSLVAALMQAQRSEPIKTFSIGFETEAHNEAQYAAAVAKHLGTDHTELYVTAQDALDVIPKLPDMYDEPFADSSQIPTYLLSSLTKQHVTVALSGDGGDELFAGYERYFTAQRILGKLENVPTPFRHLMAKAICALSPASWDAIASIVPASKRPSNTGNRAHKFAAILSGKPDDIFRSLVSHWDHPDDIVIGGKEQKDVLWDESLASLIPDFTTRMQYMDSATYLTDDILTKVDRASMFDALEARVPLLDHRVVEFAATLPHHMKVRDGQGKWLLRQVLEKYVPKHLFNRPKMGFGVPLDAWLRGPLRDWAEDLLSKETFERHGLLNRAPILEKWQQHLSGSANWQYLLWDVLILHAWANKHK